MVVGALDVEGISAFEAKHDPILIVDSHRLEPSPVGTERVQFVAGRHFQVVKSRHRVDLIEFATHVWPELARNPPSRVTVDAVPDVPGRFIGERPNHTIAL